MADRRAEAFAVLDERKAEAEAWVNSLTHEPGLGYENLFQAVLAYLAALRSVLERHAPWRGDEGSGCRCGVRHYPCPDAQAVIDAVLGPEVRFDTTLETMLAHAEESDAKGEGTR